MTISTTTNRVTYTGNGATVDFSFPYAFFAKADLVVIETVIATGVQTTKALTTHYTIAGSVDALGHYSSGGTVTAVTAPASTVTWTIYRDPAATQTTDLVENDPMPAESIEAALDYQTMLNQRTRDIAARSLQQPEGDSATIGTLPAKVDRASKFLAFDGSGDPVVAAGTSADLTPVSAFINTLLDDGSAAAARTTLGAIGASGETATDDVILAASDSRTTTADVVLTLRSTTSGTPAAGIGTDLLLQAESADESPADVAKVGGAFSDVTAGSEDSYFRVLLRVAGAALTECWRWAATGAFKGIFTHANTADRTYTFPNASGSIPTLATQAEVNAMTSTATGLTPNHNKIVLGTPVNATSGTSIDFTGIPPGTRRVTLMLVGVSTNGSDGPLFQIGDSGGIETSGYLGGGASLQNATSVGTLNSTAGLVVNAGAAANILHGTVVAELVDAASFTWVLTANLALSSGAICFVSAATKSLSAELDRIRMTTTGGANTFDAGSVNIAYER